MDNEFEPLDKLEEVCALLDELTMKYTVHRHDEGEFSFLKDREASIEVPNPYTDRTMFIDLQDEFSLFFGKEWHDHYSPDEDRFQDLCETIKGIINNEICSRAFFYGEDLQWGGSGLAVKGGKIREMSGYYCIDTMVNEIAEYKKEWAQKDAYSELRLKFWDPKYDRIVVAGKDRYGLTDEVLDILIEIGDLLEKLGCEFDIHRDSDEEFPDYTENDGCIIVHNPHTDRNLTVEITKSDMLSEMTFYFAEQHCHYGFDELPELLDTIQAIIENEIGVGEIYQGEERRFFMSANVYRSDVESKPYAECFGSLMSGYVEEQCRENGAEVRFKFWDPQYDRSVIIEKESKT